MIRLKGVTLHRGGRRVLHDLTLGVHAGQKVGVVGANGAGKTSLLGLINGRFGADAGEVELPSGMRIAAVAQDISVTERALLDYVLDGHGELRRVEHELEAARAADDGERLAALFARYEDLGGYAAAARAAKILAGLGFDAFEHGRALSSFSGGWRVRAALARALMQPSDLLLLDEPTNHLDLDAVLWLEDWLRAYPGTLLLISHDREFLDAVVGHIAHVNDQRVTLYTGDYEAFERARAELLARERKAFERQQRDIVRIHRFVERFRYKASKARQAQSRLKALERLERIAPAHVDAPFRFRICAPERLPKPLLAVEGAAVGYDDAPVLSSLSLQLAPGQRLGILGRNGAGKSTLMKLLAGVLAPLEGERRPAPDLACGYFAQHQLEQLRDDDHALAHMQRASSASEQQARDELGRFGFSGEDTLRAVRSFSGGERARLVLALIFQQRPNLLLLDEPTNHLDLDMRVALSVALQDYAGAIVLVSHDRSLLKSCCDELWLVRDGQARPFDGDLGDYARWLRALRATSEPGPPSDAASARRAERRPRKLSYNEQRELDALPAEIERLEREQHSLQTALADPDFYRSDAEHVAATRRRLLELEAALDRAFSRWSALEAAAGER